MTWIILILLEFLFGRKGGTGVFLGWDCIFISFWLSWEQKLLGWIWSESATLTDESIDLWPVVYFSGIFFFLQQYRVFIGDSAFDWRSWFTESTILLGVRGQKYLDSGTFNKKKKKKKNREAFFYHLSRRPDINNATSLARVTISHFYEKSLTLIAISALRHLQIHISRFDLTTPPFTLTQSPTQLFKSHSTPPLSHIHTYR